LIIEVPFGRMCRLRNWASFKAVRSLAVEAVAVEYGKAAVVAVAEQDATVVEPPRRRARAKITT